jgi:hypothetical protein
MTRHIIYHVLLPLFVGTLIYWAARPTVLAFSPYHFSPFVWAKYLPNWVVFNLPDGLWSYAFVSFTLILWQNNTSLTAELWLITAFLLGILLEIGQYFHWISGTFDWLDVLIYVAFNTFSIIQFNSKKNEK